MKKLLALSGLVLASSTAAAVEKPYIGLDYVQASYELDGGGDTSPTAAQLRFGSDLTKYFGLQARATLGVDDDTIDVAANTFSVNIDGIYTLSAVARLPFGKTANIYGHVGYSYAQVSAESANPIFPNTETNDDGLSFGAGLVLPVWGGIDLEVDYTSYFSGDAYTLSGVGVGIRHYF